MVLVAQERSGRVGTFGRLARRYGLLGRRGVALACAALLAALCALALARGAAPAGLVIERAGQDVQAGAAERDEEARGPSSEVASGGEDAAEEEPPALVVHVDGAVGAPGVYELEDGARVNDAIGAAGGLVGDADTSGLNLAAPLADGEKVHVPVEGEEPPAALPAAGAGASAADGAPVNLNTADVAALDALPGIGEATAQAIVDDREANGPFSTVEDLMRVSGIGEKKFAKLEGRICV